MNLKPLHDRVLVERVNSEDKTKGGIIIPDTAQEKPMEGKVLAVGGGARNLSQLDDFAELAIPAAKQTIAKSVNFADRIHVNPSALGTIGGNFALRTPGETGNFKRAVDACLAGSQKLSESKITDLKEAKKFCEEQIKKNK